MAVWAELLGGGGLVAALGGITAIFIRLGRTLERLDLIEQRMTRLEDRTAYERKVGRQWGGW